MTDGKKRKLNPALQYMSSCVKKTLNKLGRKVTKEDFGKATKSCSIAWQEEKAKKLE